MRIGIVGMGQGGMTAAYHLKKSGADVTVFEARARGEVSYDWEDDIRSDIFGLCELPMPSQSVYRQKLKWLFVSPDWQHSLPVPPLPPMEEISVHRRGLSEYFASLAEEAGCELRFEEKVLSLTIKDEKVAGVKTEKGEYDFDLVIDASGMDSPFRAQLPAKYHVQASPDDEGVLYGYRAFFRKTPNTHTLAEGIECTMSVKHMGKSGISWANLVGDVVDVLVARTYPFDEKETEEALEDLRTHVSILSNELIFGQRVRICLRATIPVGVADGYVAIGDSAFMTMPLMGSGIESSMKAGKRLADFVAHEPSADFSAARLWGFWREYMAQAGADFAFIDSLKRWALSQKAKRIDWVFGGGLIEQSDLALVSTEEGGKLSLPLRSVLKKAGILLVHPAFTFGAIGALLRAAKAKRAAKRVPKEYSEKKISKWAGKYERALVRKKRKSAK